MKNNYENFQATEQYRTLSADLSNMPFSFVYDGRKYQGFSPEHFTLISKDTISECKHTLLDVTVEPVWPTQATLFSQRLTE